jgi:hypothetical protein
MPFPNKRIFYKPEQLMLGGIPEKLHQSIKSLAEQENKVHKFDDNLFQQESDIRSCLNLGLEIYNLGDLIKEIHIYLDSLSQNTDYAQFIQNYLQTYIEDKGIPSVGENPTALMLKHCQSNQPPNRKRINHYQVSLLAALLSLKTLLNLCETNSDMETMNNALKFLTQKHYELLEQKSTLEKMRQDLKSSIDQVFANQENIQTKPDIHLHTVEIQKLASALKNG